MIAKTSLFSLALLSLVACGGDDGQIHVTVDAKVFNDAPPPPECAVPKAGWPLGLVLGSSAMPVSYAMGSMGWFQTPTDPGPYMNMRIFEMGAGLPSSTDGARDVFILEVLKPGAGFQTGTAYVNDPDPNSTLPLARSYIFGDVDANGDFSTLYYASSGQTSFSAISEAADAPVNGTASSLNFREVDDMNNDVAMGCTTKLAKLQFYLVNTESTMAAGKPQGDLTAVSAEETHRLLAKAHQMLRQ